MMMDLSRILNGGRSGRLDSNNQPLEREDFNTPSVQVSPRKLSPELNGQPIYALHNQGVDGLVSFRQFPPNAVEQMCMLAMSLVGRSFPSGFNRVEFDFHSLENSSTPRGVTTSDNDRVKISLGLINATSEEWQDDHEMQGMLAFTTFHELFLHALPDLRAANHGVDTTSEQQDHAIILSPPTEENIYHQTVKSVLPHIPPHIKQYFLDAYLDDVAMEMERTMSGHDENDIMQWLAVLEKNIEHPNSTFWKAE
ncbi:hypothetical protein [[Pantoea] beijingensis]|nr:hypothetical protein [[Pantoea] beijingensis]